MGEYFNPRSREGSDGSKIALMNFTGISIHAPARGATYHCRRIRSSGCISIHAPARGATWTCIPAFIAFIISIHAPARGATIANELGIMSTSDFNPRSREGSDRKYYLFLLYQRFLLKQYSQITIFSNYTNIKSLILICHFPGANLSGISC